MANLLDSGVALEPLFYEQNRLKTFKKWPFAKGSCNKQKMAEAGFFKVNDDKKDDVVVCIFCRKELEGWDKTDDPFQEHRSHSQTCEFATKGKCESDYTVEEYIELVEWFLQKQFDCRLEARVKNLAEIFEKDK